MNYIDLLQELGRTRQAIESLIAATSGQGTKDLVRKRDAITWAMNRVVEERGRLAPMDVTEALSKLDDVATEIGGLAPTTKNVSTAIALAGKATAIVGNLLRLRDQPAGPAEPLASRPAALAAATTGRTFTAFCNTHNIELPPTRVTLERAMQNEADHLAIAGNENDDVDVIVVK